jgi:two-component system, NarL family, response regulator NreC
VKTLRILIADDHEVMRSGLRLMIEHVPGWSVCGEASTGREAVKLAEKLQPEIVVLDMSMPELNGLEAARQIKRRLPETEVMLFTGTRNEGLVRAAFEAGARSYLAKTDAATHFVAALEALAKHKPYFTPEVAEIVFQRFTSGVGKPNEQAAAVGLSEREREIVQLLVEGHSNKEIAGKLGISGKTVEGHRAAIMRKLKLTAFSELVRWAIRHNVIEA